jgi:alpha-galactosidase
VTSSHPDAARPRPASAPAYLRAGGVAVVLDARGPGLPHVVHWGADLGDLSEAQLTALADAARPGVVSSTYDEPTDLTLLPMPSDGWPGRPGLLGHRDGAAWSPAFVPTDVTVGPDGAAVVAEDPLAALRLTVEVRLEPSGVLRLRARLRNLGDPYALLALRLTLPLPAEATEILDLAGRHLHERSPQRHRLTVGTHERESRRGRPGLDGSLVFGAGAAGFGFGAGEVWLLHLGWSGNQHVYAERLPDGRTVLGAGETLLPGELTLARDEEYVTPWLYAAYGDGLDEAAQRVHAHLRDRPTHPATPRPVVLNTWEAVYFDHGLDRLSALVEVAADAGVERFVLDDGWMRGRVDDKAGLGDWYVDETRWPDGLDPLVRRVRARGMEFGLWVEPEMVNPVSDLFRAHPEWVLAVGDRLQRPWRHQQVLDFTHPEAFGHVLGRLDALVSAYAVDFLKWDHNRDVGEPGTRPVAHAQTLAVYRMIDMLRERHPGLEIESCASGGGRVDLGILERTDRVWASDCNDALERQSIQRWTQQLLPPELVASHVGAPRAHSTGRAQDLAFRAGTALFGHFGVEWDLTRATAAEHAELARWIALYKRLRPLLRHGRVVRGDHPDPALWVHGVVAPDGASAVYAVVAVAAPLTAPPGRVRLPGLLPDAVYQIAPLAPGDRPAGVNHMLPEWWARGGCALTGRALARAGVQVPDLYPQQLVLVRAERTA